MSDRDAENIRSLRRAHEAFSRGDFDAAMEIAHPEVEFIPPGGQSPIRGAKAFRAWMEPDALEEQRIEPLEFRTNGNRVLVRQNNLGPWSDQWHRVGLRGLGRLDPGRRRLGDAGGGLPPSSGERSPRSRRAAGVVDVA